MKSLKVNFIGNFGVGYVGETADEVILARELTDLGHKVVKVPRDQWRDICNGVKPNKDWVLPKVADINIVAKWDGFNGGIYINKLREVSGAPVFYWTWDWMQWPDIPRWHLEVALAADVHLTNEGGQLDIMKKAGVNAYYFPFDVADGELPIFNSYQKKYDVTFFGSCIDQGDRKKWLPIIAKKCDLTVFGWNHTGWQELGLKAYPPVYGDDFRKKLAQSKITLQFSTCDHIWGYWSNRVGKVLSAGGFLLARYSPGMELFLRDGVDYFSSPDEAIEKIQFYLRNVPARLSVQMKGKELGELFTTKQRIKELVIFIERYLYE
jgi:hypothetical protein